MRFHSTNPHSELELLVAGRLRQMAHRQTPYVGLARLEKRLRRQRRPKVKFSCLQVSIHPNTELFVAP